jgi:hypothetical protein
MILGFDCSTTCCGFSFFNGSQIVNAGFIDISKIETNKNKVYYIINFIDSLDEIKHINKINLEAALSGFMGGKSTQQTIIKLTRFNAIFEFIISEHWKVPVILLSASTCRKQILGKSFIKGLSSKEYVKLEFPKLHPEIKKFEKNNQRGNWNVKNQDMYDAALISCVV